MIFTYYLAQAFTHVLPYKLEYGVFDNIFYAFCFPFLFFYRHKVKISYFVFLKTLCSICCISTVSEAHY